jgi:hypothetical protein
MSIFIFDARFEVFTAVKIQVVFWSVMACNVVGYQCFRGPSCHHLQGEVTGDVKEWHTSFEAFMVLMIQIVFQVMTSCSYVVGDGPLKQYPTRTLQGVTTQKTST